MDTWQRDLGRGHTEHGVEVVLYPVSLCKVRGSLDIKNSMIVSDLDSVDSNTHVFIRNLQSPSRQHVITALCKENTGQGSVGVQQLCTETAQFMSGCNTALLPVI